MKQTAQIFELGLTLAIEGAGRRAARTHKREGLDLSAGWEDWCGTAYEHDSTGLKWPDGSYETYEAAFRKERERLG